MRKRSVAILMILVGACAAPLSARIPPPAPFASLQSQTLSTSPQPRPRVRLVATGGTISNKRGGRLTADQLVASVPTLPDVASVETEQFVNVASGEITLEQWLALARRLDALLREDAGLAGVVVTSGTDTLEELAYFLHLTVRDRRPIVVTGAMRNPNLTGHEGPANLLAAVRVAAEPAAAGRGVLVVLNDEINGARDVTKTDAHRLQTFASRGFGPLGIVDGDAVVFRRTAEGRHTAASEFDVRQITELPRVDILLVYQGASGDLVKAAVDLGAMGLVVATAGDGARSGTQDEGIRYARQKGVPVVLTTRTGSGRVTTADRQEPPASASADRVQWISAGDLAPVKARVLLMLALTKTRDDAELQRMFDEY